MVGGFGLCGVPMNLIEAVKVLNPKNLTIASNDCGYGDIDPAKDWGLAVLLRNKQIKRMIASFLGENI
jgi:3-oxoacid CoA-transferase subunit A